MRGVKFGTTTQKLQKNNLKDNPINEVIVCGPANK